MFRCYDSRPFQATAAPLTNGNTFTSDALSSALFGKTRRAVLALLYAHPDESFYLREIARFVEGGHGSVQRELRRLADAQIIRRTVRGRTAFYQANRDCPIFPDLHGLILKTAGVVEVLKASLSPLADRIEIAFVYGSFAQGRPKSSSDVDMMVIGPVSFGDIAETLTTWTACESDGLRCRGRSAPSGGKGPFHQLRHGPAEAVRHWNGI